MPGTYLDFPTAWQQFVAEIPADDRGDVVKGLTKILSVPTQNEVDRDRAVKAACHDVDGWISLHRRRLEKVDAGSSPA